MTVPRTLGALRMMLVGGLLYGAGLIASVSHAVVTSSGLNTAVDNSTPGVYAITGGTRPDVSPGTPGPNLFHSFGDFSLNTPESANFLNNSGLATTNILARVTGPNPSNIFGTIDTSDFGGANLFLMNPAGILFGPTAQLNVGGSFHATTADFIRLGPEETGGVFTASGAGDMLTVDPPSAFGFLSANPASIDVQAGIFGANILRVPDGQTLSFVGGTVNVGAAPGDPPAGFLLASEGRINLVSVASAGEATFDGTGFNVDSVAQLGDINITGNSLIDAREVFIRGGQLTINDGTIYPGVFALLGLPVAPPDGGEVNIAVSDSVNMTATSPAITFPGIQTYAGSRSTLVSGDVPDINITAGGSISIANGAQVTAQRLGPGNPADLLIAADTVEVRNGSGINSLNNWSGPGGTVTVNATDVTLDSQGSPAFTGISVVSNFHPAYTVTSGAPFFDFFQFADSGAINVNATGTLTVRNNAQITTDSFSFGRGGDLTINAGDMVLVGAGVNTGLIGAQSGFGGASGNITIHATGTIDMQNGFRIAGGTLGSGDGGAVSVSADQAITMTDARTQISSTAGKPLSDALDVFAQRFGVADYASLLSALGITPSANDLMDVLAALSTVPGPGGIPLVALTDFTSGNGGSVTVTTPVFTATNGAKIETSTSWGGNAGVVTANVGSLFLDTGASVSSVSGVARIDTGPTVGVGNAGEIDVTATDTISISGRSPTTGESSFISTSTFGDGNAGSISLSANQVNIQNGGGVTSESGGTLAGQFLVGTGNAGTVTITATGSNTLTISGAGSTVSTTTNGAGAGGDISLASAGDVNISNGGGVTAEASSTGDAGIIGIAAADLLSISGNNSTVSTTTSGAGDGGSISLTSAGDVQILGGGLVSADSLSTDLDAGDTGDITITADNSITLSNGTISTQAVQADGGNIKLTAPNIVQLTGSDITTSIFKEGGGNGGNINIDPEFVTFNKSQVIANAFTGTGGNIQITAANFIPSADSVVDASSQFGVQGTIVIQSPENDIAGSISQLPQSIVDVSGLLPESCAARHAGGRELSSFVVAGRGGLPTNPDNYLPSFGAGSAPMKSGGTAAPGMSLSDLGYANQTTVAMAGWGCLP